MPRPLQLFDVFPALRTTWPLDLVAQSTDGSGMGWLELLNRALQLHDLTVNSSLDGVGVACRFAIDQSGGVVHFRHARLDGVEFRLNNLPHTRAAYLFVKTDTISTEILIEGLPVEIRLSKDIIGIHPHDFNVLEGGEGEVSYGAFGAGNTNSQQITLRRESRELGTTSVFTHLRVRVHPDLSMEITTPLPISFGLCSFLGFPCLGVYDFQLLPNPRLAYNEADQFNTINWLRHGISSEVYHGVFTVRTVYLDFVYWVQNGGQFSHMLRSGQSGYERPPSEPATAERPVLRTEWVFNDLVFPLVFPVPVHATVGFRKHILEFEDVSDIFNFDHAPIFLPIHFSDSFIVDLRIYKFFIQTREIRNALEFFQSFQISIGVSVRDNSTQATDDNFQILLEVAENATARLGFTFIPAPDRQFFRIVVSDDLIIDGIGAKVGYNFGKSLGEKKPFEQCFEATMSLWLHDSQARFPNSDALPAPPPTSGGGSGVHVENADDTPFSVVVTELGWKQGAPAIETFQLPEGSQLKVDSFGLDLLEIGILSEEGASYFSLSGGIHLQTEGFEGGVWFYRFRFKVGGNPAAANFKLDGFAGLLKIPEVVKIEIGGYIRNETEGSITIRELAFSGRIEILQAPNWIVALDLISGTYWDRDREGAAFTFLMIQVAIQGNIPLGPVELRSLRVLFADKMMPMTERDSNVMRYYNWSRDQNPLLGVPNASRRMRAWKPQQHSFAFGAGFGISFVGLGDVFRLDAFGMYVEAPDERGLLISIELFLLQASTRPVGWAVLEYDFINDRFAILIGVDLNLGTFINNAPEQLGNLFRIRGSIFIGNKPGTFAIGRIADERSWLTLLIELDLFNLARVFVRIAFCVEIVEDGPGGFGLIVRIEGRIDAGFFAVAFFAGLLFKYQSFKNGASDFSVIFIVEAGLSISVLRFLNFGISVRFEVNHVGHLPNYTLLRATFSIDLPWFLPDISWTWELLDGSISPATRPLVTSPLLAGSAGHEATKSSAPLHVERFRTELFSLEQIEAIGETARLERFEASLNAPAGERLEKVPTDATIAIVFSSPVIDVCGFGETTEDRFGTQSSGDETVALSNRLRLTGFSIRRRPRYGAADRMWHSLEERRELSVRLEGGVVTTGAFEPSQVTKMWDVDLKIAGQPVAKTLLVNASTPFQYGRLNEQGDDQLLRSQPNWPCCPDREVPIHEFYFNPEAVGPMNPLLLREISHTHSLVCLGTSAYIKPPLTTTSETGFKVSDRIASFAVNRQAMLLNLVLDEAAIEATFRLSVIGSDFSLLLVAEDLQGEIVAQVDPRPSGTTIWTDVLLRGNRPFRSVTLLVGAFYDNPQLPPKEKARFVEVDRIAYESWADHQRRRQVQAYCRNANNERELNYSGRGKIFFLANHDYEIALTTEIAVRHTSTEWEQRVLTEYLYFSTKGLPGLNATARTGEEIEPYVQTRYRGPRGLVYRNEPVLVVFKENLSTVFPLEGRPRDTAEEHVQLMEMVLQTTLDNAVEPDHLAQTRENIDWLEQQKPIPDAIPWAIFSDMFLLRALTSDPFLLRLSHLLRFGGASRDCTIPGAATVQQQTLIAHPFGTEIIRPHGVTEKLWFAQRSYLAKVKLKGAPFIHRQQFLSTDLDAFTYRDPDGRSLTPSAWRIEDGQLVFSAPLTQQQYAVFGEERWAHFELRTSIMIKGNQSGVAGLALGLNASFTTGIYIYINLGSEEKQLSILKSGELVFGPTLLEASSELEIQVIACDDLIRVRVGNQTHDIARDEIREGRCALIAEGDVSFASLLVEGLTLYQFDFSTSQFESFSAHIKSFPTQASRLAPIDATLTMENMRTRYEVLRTEALEGMRAEVSDEIRENNFIGLVEEFSIPLASRVGKAQFSLLDLEHSNFAPTLLLESPEPIDFVREVSLRLIREMFLDESGIIEDRKRLAAWVKIIDYADRKAAPHVLNLKPSNRLPFTPWKTKIVVANLIAKKDGTARNLTIERNASREAINWKNVRYIEIDAEGTRLYRCERISNNEAYAVLEKNLPDLPVLAFDDRTNVLSMLLNTRNRNIIFAYRHHQQHYREEMAFDLIQNGPATRALIFLRSATGLVPFRRATYELTFTLQRRRFESLESHEFSAYNDNAQIIFT